MAPDGLSGDLNMEDFESPFLLMWPCKKLNLSCIQVCLSVLFTAACPDFLCVSFPYPVHCVLNHFLAVLTKIFLGTASLSHIHSFLYLSLNFARFSLVSNLKNVLNLTSDPILIQILICSFVIFFLTFIIKRLINGIHKAF